MNTPLLSSDGHGHEHGGSGHGHDHEHSNNEGSHGCCGGHGGEGHGHDEHGHDIEHGGSGHDHGKEDHGHDHGGHGAHGGCSGHDHGKEDHGHDHGGHGAHGGCSGHDHGGHDHGVHGHGHGGHGHDHGGHGHGPGDENTTKLRRAIYFALFFMVCELVGGYLANSIAIMTDAAHMLSDVGGLSASLLAIGITHRKADLQHTYGFHQANVVGAGISILLVWLLTGALLTTAVHRLRSPQEVDGQLMFALATLGLVVNLVLMKILGHSHGHGGDDDHGHSHGDDLAMSAALVHVIGDVLQSIGVMLAGLVIWKKPFDVGLTDNNVSNWNYADPICTFLFAILVLCTTKGTAQGILNSIMMKAPRNLDVGRIKLDLEKVDGVNGIHDLHVWSVGPHPCLTCHVVIGSSDQLTPVLTGCKKVCGDVHGVRHSTLQLEVEGEFNHEKEDHGALTCVCQH